MTKRFFCYQVGEYQIILEPEVNPELLFNHQIYPVPFAPAWCLGLTVVHGDLIPVVNMHGLLLKSQTPDKPYLLRIEQSGLPSLVLSCDHLPQQLILEDTAIEPILQPGQGQADSTNLPDWVEWVDHQNSYQLLAADHQSLFKSLQQLSGSMAPWLHGSSRILINEPCSSNGRLNCWPS